MDYNEKIASARNELEKKMADLQVKILAMDIIEGKVSVVDEVKKRILEVCPGISNIDYILWPIRVSVNKSIPNEKRKVKSHDKIVDWNDQVINQMLIDGRHDEMMEEYGMTYASIRSRAYKLGYVFRLNKPLQPKSAKNENEEVSNNQP